MSKDRAVYRPRQGSLYDIIDVQQCADAPFKPGDLVRAVSRRSTGPVTFVGHVLSFGFVDAAFMPQWARQFGEGRLYSVVPLNGIGSCTIRECDLAKVEEAQS